jgi:hypothetical protein
MRVTGTYCRYELKKVGVLYGAVCEMFVKIWNSNCKCICIPNVKVKVHKERNRNFFPLFCMLMLVRCSIVDERM